MNTRKLSIIVGSITLLLLVAGLAGAHSNRSPASPAEVEGTVSGNISYQGRLTSPAGVPLHGTYTMRFVVYNAPSGGTALWNSGNQSVTVDNGLFNVMLGVNQGDFDGQGLWLRITVNGEVLSPRQQILPAPYALSLRPGADIVGDSIGAADATLAGYAPATGTALYADAHNGVGVFGDSENTYGVWGSSNNSWGGYFTSQGGYGIRVDTTGDIHYDHGAYITSNGGYGVYAQSAQNMGVRGEAGDVTGISHPIGPVGVVGIGTNRGSYSSSSNGTGSYATSSNNYGVWGNSGTYRGVTGRTNRPDDNYGFYTPDNLYSKNINFAGALMQVMQNGDSSPLAPGDVVIFSGINRSVEGTDSPVVQVSRTSMANNTAVAGVVFSRFNIDAVNPDLEAADDSGQGKMAQMEVTPDGEAAPGEFVLVVVQGPALVNADALAAGSIQPGELLSTAGSRGIAAKAASVTLNGVETAAPGTVFAKALEPLDGGKKQIYVYVTLGG